MKPTSPTSTQPYSPPGSGSHRACPWLGYLIASSSRKVLQSAMEDIVREGCCEPSDNQAPQEGGFVWVCSGCKRLATVPQDVLCRRQGNTCTVYMWPSPRTVAHPGVFSEMS